MLLRPVPSCPCHSLPQPILPGNSVFPFLGLVPKLVQASVLFFSSQANCVGQLCHLEVGGGRKGEKGRPPSFCLSSLPPGIRASTSFLCSSFGSTPLTAQHPSPVPSSSSLFRFWSGTSGTLSPPAPLSPSFLFSVFLL